MSKRQPKSIVSIADTDGAIIVGKDGEVYAWNENGGEIPLSGSGVGVGALVSELRSATGSNDGEMRDLKGYTTAGDGGEGRFRWSTGTATDDGGTIFNVNGYGVSATGYWQRIYSGPFDVQWFGADATGATDARAAIQRALDQAYALGGGEVFAPKGTYQLSGYLNVQTGVTLLGAGRKRTRFVLTVSANAYGINVGPDQTDFGLLGFTIDASVTGATTQTTGINLAATSGHEILRGHIDDVGIENQTFAGLFTEYVQDLTIGTLYVKDQTTCSDGGSGRLGGPAVWFFKGTARVTAAAILIDGTSDGVFCDTGTETGGGDETTDIAIGVLNVNRWGQDSSATGSALGVQGAKRVNVGVLGGHGDATTAANIVNGITIEQDQNAVVAQDIHIGSANLSNFGGYPVIFRGAQRCSIGPLKIKDGLQAIKAFGVGYAIRFEPPNYLLDGSTAADTIDCTIGPVDVEIADTTNSRYDYGVLFQGGDVTLPDMSTTPSSALRNRVIGGRWGTGAASTLTPSAVYNVSASGSGTAPVTGANANLIDGRDVDNRTPLIQGMPLKIDVPGVGRVKIGPQNSTYCHVETDRDNMFFTKESAATCVFFFNGPRVQYPKSGSTPNGGYVSHDFASDADYTPPYTEYYAEILAFTDLSTHLTTGRNVIMPLAQGAKYDVVNLTAQTLTFKGATGTGVAVTAGAKARIVSDGVNWY